MMKRTVGTAALSCVLGTFALAGCSAGPPLTTASSMVCPVNGHVAFSNDWHAPRAGGQIHEGNDVMAPRGTPVVAVVAGVVGVRFGARSGNAVWFSGDDGNAYFYAHFEWPPAVPDGAHVHRGDVIGYMGNSGDAAGGPTHTHFEIHPHNGDPINPYPTLLLICPNR